VANAPKFSNAAVNAEAEALSDLFDGGDMRIYTAPKPATADDPPGAATLLGTCTFGTPAFGAAVAGLLTANAIGGDGAADATGTAAWFRARTAAAATIMDGTIGEGAGFDAIIDSDAIQTDADINVLSFTLQVSKG
jgi:hypothetical protein